MKAIPSTTKPIGRAPAAATLQSKRDALERGERTPSRVFRIEKLPDGTVSRVAVNPETQRRKSAKAWEAKSEVAKVRHSLNLTRKPSPISSESDLACSAVGNKRSANPPALPAC